MEPLGPKLAEGRDSEIFEHGPGRVLRRARDGRSLVHEAEIMRYAGEHGFPVPAVHDAGAGFLVMDRLEGPTLLDHAIPFRLGRAGRMLADLHNRLHAIPAPGWLPEAGIPGTQLVHRDLHPLNVIVTDHGPVVIDWSNAARGDPAYDAADVWVLLACADPPLNAVERALAPLARKVLLGAFLRGVDREAVRPAIPDAVAHRLTDRNMSPAERARMESMAGRARADL